MSDNPPPPASFPFTRDDVLYGKERLCQENGGNVLLRQLIHQLFDEYEAADVQTDVRGRRSKQDIVSFILKALKESGARFLKRSIRGTWEEVSDIDASKKIVDGFKTPRKAAVKRRRSSKTVTENKAILREYGKLSGKGEDVSVVQKTEARWACQSCSYTNSNNSFLCAMCGERRYNQHNPKKENDSSVGATKPVAQRQIPIMAAHSDGEGTPALSSSADNSPSQFNFTHVFAVLNMNYDAETKALVEKFSDTGDGVQDLMLFHDVDFDKTLKRYGLGHVDRSRLRDFRLWFQTHYVPPDDNDKPLFTRKVWNSFREQVNIPNKKVAVEPLETQLDEPIVDMGKATDPVLGAAQDDSPPPPTTGRANTDATNTSLQTVGLKKTGIKQVSSSMGQMSKSASAQKSSDEEPSSTDLSFNSLELENASLSSSQLCTIMVDIVKEKPQGIGKRLRKQQTMVPEIATVLVHDDVSAQSTSSTPGVAAKRQKGVVIDSNIASTPVNLPSEKDCCHALSSVPLPTDHFGCSSVGNDGTAFNPGRGSVSITAPGSTSERLPVCEIGMDFGFSNVSSLSSNREKSQVSAQRRRGGRGLVPTTLLVQEKEENTNPRDDLSAMTIKARRNEHVGELKEIQDILRDVRDNPGDAKLQTRRLGDICHFLWEIESFQTEFGMTTVSYDVLETTLSTLKVHQENRRVQRAALSLIDYLFSKDGNALHHICRLAGFEQLLLYMAMSLGDEIADRHSVLILKRLSTSSRCQDGVKANGGLVFLTDVVERHSTTSQILVDCLDTLDNLVSMKCQSKQSHEVTFAVRSIPTVVAAMQHHSSHAEVLAHSCSYLANLASHSNCREAIAATNAVQAVLAVMEQYLFHVGVQANACCLLGTMACDHDAMIVAANGIPAVVMAMRRHQSHVRLQEDACVSLGRLAFNHDGINAIIEGNGIPAVVSAMQQHRCHAGLQEKACSSLAQMASHSNCRAAFVAANGVPAVVAAVRNHPTHAGLQARASYLLRNLARFGSLR